MMWRARVVSAIGIVGMALAFLYIFAVFLAFQPGFSDLTYLFVGRSDRELPTFVLSAVVPYGLLMAHLYLRTGLGGVFLKHGAVEDAITYTSNKVKPSLMRSSTEAAFHRLFLAKALVRQLRYDEALKVLDDLVAVPRRLRDEYSRWTLEILLRQENLTRANQVAKKIRTSKSEAAGCAWAAVAELATRQNDKTLFDTAWKNAVWALRPTHPRLAFTALGAARRFEIPPVGDDAAGFLNEIPGAGLEWAAMRGNTEAQVLADQRSKYVAEGLLDDHNSD
jgi:hypothetical protein